MSAEIETPKTEIQSPVVSSPKKSSKKSRRKRNSEFPVYVPGKTCVKQGKEHQFVVRGTYKTCKVCGSSAMIREATASTGQRTNKSKKSKKAPAQMGASSAHIGGEEVTFTTLADEIIARKQQGHSLKVMTEIPKETN